MKNNVVGIIVSATVSLLCIGLILMPTLSDASQTDGTFTNEGYYRMSDITEDITMVWDHDSPSQVTVNDTVISLENVPTDRITTLIITDTMLVRYAPVSAGTIVQVYSSSGYLGASVSDGTDMTVTVSDGSITAVVGTNNATESYTEGYHISDDGDWTMKYSDETAYVHKSDSLIVLAGSTVVDTATIGILASGTINDGLEMTTIQTSDVEVTPTYGDVEFVYTDVDGYDDLVSLSQCEFTITVDSTTIDATYSYFLVPYEVTAELSEHLGITEITILSVIPVILIMAVLLGVTYAVMRNRD